MAFPGLHFRYCWTSVDGGVSIRPCGASFFARVFYAHQVLLQHSDGHALQADFLKLLYDKLTELHMRHADTSDEWKYPLPSFKASLL